MAALKKRRTFATNNAPITAQFTANPASNHRAEFTFRTKQA